jgi:hypothetical protein
MNYINIYIKLLFRESLICQSGGGGGATPEWVWGASARGKHHQAAIRLVCAGLGDAREPRAESNETKTKSTITPKVLFKLYFPSMLIGLIKQWQQNVTIIKYNTHTHLL